MIATITRFGQRMFTRYLLATNIGTSCFLMNTGDCIVQAMQHHFHKKSGKDLEKNEWMDWERGGRVFVVGGVLGGLTHYWYALLDWKLPGTAVKTIGKKILLDQTIASPLFMAVYFIGHALLEKETLKEGVNRVKEKFLVVYMTDWSYWPLVQGINFRFVPDRFRVVYVSASSLLWNVFLSYMQFVDEKHLGHPDTGQVTQHPDNRSVESKTKVSQSKSVS